MHSFLPLKALYNEMARMGFDSLFIVSVTDIITDYIGFCFLVLWKGTY